MKKRSSILGMTLAVCMLSSVTASASIDMSVFEGKPDMYEIEIDDFDDTGTITLLDEPDSYRSNASASVYKDDGESFSISDDLYVSFDIRIINDGELAVPRVSLLYYGEDWIFTEKVIIKIDDKRFTFELESATDTYNGKVYEGMELVCGTNGIQLLEQIAKEYEENVEEYKDETDLERKELFQNSASMKGRLAGSSAEKDFFVSIRKANRVAQLYYDFVEAGGLEQDLRAVDEEFPCIIKEMD